MAESQQILDKNYWEKRYHQGLTGWDIGEVSTPLKLYIDQLSDKEQKILIPGAGNAHEVEYLHRQGFKNVYLLDIALEPIIAFQNRTPDFPAEHLINEDFFNHTGKYDLIIEQTFFCALPVNQRKAYAKKSSWLLKTGGKLTGVLFNSVFEQAGPPFGGTKEEYKPLFSEYFLINVMDTCYNSIKPRAGKELFIILQNK